jgi:hypothetical protein
LKGHSEHASVRQTFRRKTCYYLWRRGFKISPRFLYGLAFL